MPRQVLVLVNLNPDLSDAGCHQYPQAGLVEALDFSRNKPDLLSGLFGVLWAKDSLDSYIFPEGSKYAVVEVPVNDDLIVIGKLFNVVMFKRGNVVFIGDKQNCLNYIAEHKNDVMTLKDKNNKFDFDKVKSAEIRE